MSGMLRGFEAVGATVSADLGGLAFDEVVRRYKGHISRVLRALVRDADLAETLTQECFLRAWRGRDGFRGEAQLATWLRRIACRVAIDHARSARATFWRRLLRLPANPGGVVEVSDPAASPERRLLAREDLRAVQVALDRLSRQQRLAFQLRFGLEMTLEEIAVAMAIEVGTVKSHLARAVGAVRRNLKKEEQT